MTAKKATRKPSGKTIVDRLDESVLGTPIKMAERTYLAGLGVISTIRDEINVARPEWDKKFRKLVKDGKKARDAIEADWVDFRKDVEKQLTTAKDKVLERVRPAAAK